MNEAEKQTDRVPERIAIYDDSDPVMAALSRVDNDTHATDNQRQAARMAMKEILRLRDTRTRSPVDRGAVTTEQDGMVDEAQRRMDAVVDAAVEWHQSGREGDNTWFDKAETLGQAIDRLLELREKPEVLECVGCDWKGKRSDLVVGNCPQCGDERIAPAADSPEQDQGEELLNSSNAEKSSQPADLQGQERQLTGLLPCPWCGATPTVFDHSIEGFKSEWSVYCKGEMCAVAPSTTGEFKQHAISQWNNQTVARHRSISGCHHPGAHTSWCNYGKP